jgi:hypothetical protein
MSHAYRQNQFSLRAHALSWQLMPDVCSAEIGRFLAGGMSMSVHRLAGTVIRPAVWSSIQIDQRAA